MTPPRRSISPAVLDPSDAPAEPLAHEDFSDDDVGGTLFLGPNYDGVQWSIHRLRTRSEMADDAGRGKRLEWVHDCVGEIRGSELVPMIGGGTFNFRGYVPRDDGNGVRLAFNEVVTLAGPRKDFSRVEAAAAVAPSTPVAPVSNGDPTARMLRRMLREQREDRERMTRALERLSERPAQSSDLMQMIAGMRAMDEMRGDHQPAVDPLSFAKEFLTTHLAGVSSGVEIGRGQPPGDPDAAPNYVPLIEKAIDVLGPVLGRAMSRGRPMPPGGPPPRSSARVVEDPPAPAHQAAAEPARAPTPAHRWHTAIEALYRAQLHGKDPADFAESLEDMLDPDEIGMMKLASADDVLTTPQLADVLKQFPALSEHQGRVYLGAVLTALRAEDGDGAGPGVDGEDSPR